jgi:ketosteroid isomerase-like protein
VASGNAAAEVQAAVTDWASAWSTKDVKRYLAAYGKDFDTPGTQSRSAWENERQQRIVGKRNISVKLTDLNVTVNGNKATARFRQDYKADALDVNSRKSLDLVKVDGRWVIVRESTGG